MLGKRLRVKLLLLALLASAAGVGMDNSSACGYVKCAVILVNGQVTGYGCSQMLCADACKPTRGTSMALDTVSEVKWF